MSRRPVSVIDVTYHCHGVRGIAASFAGKMATGGATVTWHRPSHACVAPG